MKYVKAGLFNANLMYLLEGIPSIVKKYSKYTSDEMFKIWDYEYSNIESTYITLIEFIHRSQIHIRGIDMDLFDDLEILQNNLDLSDVEIYDQFDDTRRSISYIGNVPGTLLKTGYNYLELTKDGDTYKGSLKFSISPSYIPEVKLKNGRTSFENLVFYVLYNRFACEIITK
jgi:hypothetical protein